MSIGYILEGQNLTTQSPRVEVAIAYARQRAAEALDPMNWGFIDQGTTLNYLEADIARAELQRLQESIQCTVDQRLIAEALGDDLFPA